MTELDIRQIALETAMFVYESCKVQVETDRVIMGAAITAFEKSRQHMQDAERELHRLMQQEFVGQ